MFKNKFSCALVFLLGWFFSVFSFDVYSDGLLNTINWPGPLNSDDYLERDSIIITTNLNEKFKCLLPSSDKAGYKNINEAISPAKLELELLRPIFDIPLCTYRLETYWTYQLCHGKHIRQYHEENKNNLQEYFLGLYTMDKFKSDLDQAKLDREQGIERKKRYEKVSNLDLPYYEVVYEGGTVCDVTNTARKSRVKYVCQEDGKGEVYDLKEVASCEYDIIVLTNLLCKHPAYGPKKDVIHSVDCHSLEGTDPKPKNLLQYEALYQPNRFDFKQNGLNQNIWEAVQTLIKQQMGADTTIIFKDTEEDEGGIINNRQEVTINNLEQGPPPIDPPIVVPSSKHVLGEFLDGTYCIEGGIGWWKHEFCYGKHILQYHEEGATKTKIILGLWDKLSHLMYLENHPNKRPKPLIDRKYVTQYYANGQICDETGLHRSVEVRFKCADASPGSSISLYLLEPVLCEYRLVVESAMFCSILGLADDNGLFPSDIRL